jgi:hypothetical protein
MSWADAHREPLRLTARSVAIRHAWPDSKGPHNPRDLGRMRSARFRKSAPPPNFLHYVCVYKEGTMAGCRSTYNRTSQIVSQSF